MNLGSQPSFDRCSGIVTLRNLPACIRRFVISRLLLSLGRQIVQVFVPLLLMQHGLALRDVFGFYAFGYIASALLVSPAVNFLASKGARAAFIIAYSATVVYQVLLGIIIEQGTIWGAVMKLAGVLATANILHLVADAAHVAQGMTVSRKGRDNAYIQAAIGFAAIVGPLIGTAVAIYVGQLWLTVCAAALVILGLIQVLSIHEHDRPPPLAWGNRAPRRDMVAGGVYHCQASIGIVLWPVYLALAEPSVRAIGGIVVAASLIAFAVITLSAYRVDRGNGHDVLLATSVFVAGINLVRPWVVGAAHLTLVTAAFSIVFAGYSVAWLSRYYHGVREKGLRYVRDMEIVGCLSEAAPWIGLWLLSYWGLSPVACLRAGFISAAIIILGNRLTLE